MGRLTDIIEKNQKAEKQMRTFCLNPSKESFDFITNNNSVKRSDYYSTWRTAVIFYYDFDYPLTTIELMDEYSKFNNMIKEVESSHKYPSRTYAIKTMAIYWAIGDIKYLDLYYQFIGHEGLGMGIRKDLAREFDLVKKLYLNTLHELLTADPDHLTKHDIKKNHVDFTHFEQYEKEWDKKRRERFSKSIS